MPFKYSSSIRIVLAALLLSLGTSFCNDGCTRSGSPMQTPAVSKTVRCPVCDLEFNSAKARATSDYGKKKFYFLLEDHKDAFDADPTAFLPPASGE
jgi:YHS domain-containing protein